MNSSEGTKIIKTTSMTAHEVTFDLQRLIFMVFAYINPRPGMQCSIRALQETILTLQLLNPETWKDEMAKIISSVPGSCKSTYTELITGINPTRSSPDFILPTAFEDKIKFLHSNIEYKDFASNLRQVFKLIDLKLKILESYSKGPEFFSMFISLYYLFDSDQFFIEFQDLVDKRIGLETIEKITEFLEKFEKGLKVVPNGKVLHVVYRKLASLLIGNQGAKSLAEFFHFYLMEDRLPELCYILYVLCEQKDVLEKFHLELCIQRLLVRREVEFELKLVEIIRENTGPEALESVMSLLKSTVDYNIQYENMNVLIITQKHLKLCNFPIHTNLELDAKAFPSPLNSMISGYSSIFTEKFPKKILNFLHLNGILELKYGSSTLVCNFLQSLIFLSFNSKPILTKSEICKLISPNENIEKLVLEAIDSLKPVLKLEKEGLVVQIPENQNYDFNKKVRENEEIDEKNDGIEESRKIRIDCFVVRLLKHENQMDLAQLSQRIPAALGFVPSDSLLESRYKRLEEKGFIWRVEK